MVFVLWQSESTTTGKKLCKKITPSTSETSHGDKIIFYQNIIISKNLGRSFVVKNSNIYFYLK